VSPADFAGDWQIGRRITDRLTGQTGQFDGIAVLSPQGTGDLRYSETGKLLWGDGPPLQADRTYLWVFEDGQARVLFADGRPFHSFQPGISGAGTDHLCGADLYRVTYGFTDWPEWSVQWDVSGPRKDYTLVSRYWR
jgi:hypothetical protein